MSADFIDTYKQRASTFPNESVRSTELELESELICSIVELEDKLLVSLSLNGEMDISYDLQLDTINKNPMMPVDMKGKDYEEGEVYGEDELNESNDIKNQINPIVLIGDSSNLKSQVMAAEIGKLLNQFTQKNVILNTSGKLWRKSLKISESEFNKVSDFEKLLIVLQLVKSCVTGES